MKSPTQLPEYQMVGWVSWFQMTDRRCSVLTKASVIIPAVAAMAPPQAQEARMIGRGQEARMQEVISWSWKQFCPSPRAARRPHPFLIQVIIIKCNLQPAHFQYPPSFPTSPSDWRKANQKVKRVFLQSVKCHCKVQRSANKGKGWRDGVNNQTA